jgi:hypothetical protein
MRIKKTCCIYCGLRADEIAEMEDPEECRASGESHRMVESEYPEDWAERD